MIGDKVKSYQRYRMTLGVAILCVYARCAQSQSKIRYLRTRRSRITTPCIQFVKMSSMAILPFFYLLFLNYFGSQASGLEMGGSKIGETCERDYHCIANAFCRSQMTCLCESNYLPVPDFSLCVPTVGLFCSADSVCALMSNAECKQNVCACKETFTVDIRNTSNCLARPVAEYDSCQRNDDCIDSMDRALCINNQCQCLTSHHFSQVSQKCVRTAGIFQGCENDEQCYMADMGDDANSLVCTEGVCKCADGNTSKHCNGAASNSGTLIIAALFFFFAIFVV